MKDSKIEWCDHTINLWWGCSKVSPGCANCYASGISRRFGKDIWGPGKAREDHRDSAIKLAERLDRKAAKEGVRYRVFSSSMSDWLDPDVPVVWLADLLALIRRTPNLDWLLLTKRPGNWRDRMVQVVEFVERTYSDEEECERFGCLWGYLVSSWLDSHRPYHPSNIWIGTSVEDQQRADERIPALLEIPARVRFLSCEPLLGPVDLERFGEWAEPQDGGCFYLDGIHWVIAGGESGQRARPMHPDWARSLRDQCRGADVPFFMKQMGGSRKPFADIPEDLMIREFP